VHDVFYAQTKNPPFGGTLHKICMIFMFSYADTILLWKWLTMDIWKKKFGPEITDVTFPRKTYANYG